MPLRQTARVTSTSSTMRRYPRDQVWVPGGVLRPGPSARASSSAEWIDRFGWSGSQPMTSQARAASVRVFLAVRQGMVLSPVGWEPWSPSRRARLVGGIDEFGGGGGGLPAVAQRDSETRINSHRGRRQPDSCRQSGPAIQQELRRLESG